MTFSQLSLYFQEIESTSSRLAMTATLAQLFKKATSVEIGSICYLLQGRVVPLYEAVEFGMADKLVIRAITLAFGAEQSSVEEDFLKSGDLGKTAEVFSERAKKKTGDVTVNYVFDSLVAIARSAGFGSQDRKIAGLAKIFAEVTPLSLRYIARIPLDKLRLGFSDMTILDGLSWMLAGDKTYRQQLEDAYNVCPDIAFIARAVKEHGIKGLDEIHAHVGVPIFAALCQRIPTADEMIKKMGTVAVEPKYDGVRCQIHWKKKGFVKSFSRNLEQTTQMFPELMDIEKQLNADEVILDSEAVGIDPVTGKILPFQETTTRKRKYDIELFSTQVPLRFYVFDILYKDGKDMLLTPLSKRREILEKTIKEGEILSVSPLVVTDSAQTLREYHDTQIKKGLEGVVVKKWESPYDPGRRNYSWVKFKEEEGKTGKLADTIDAVVMGFYRGEGKRAGFGIGAFLVGVKKGETIVTVSKIGTGVSDDLWKELKVRFEKLKTNKQPQEYAGVAQALVPDVWITPKLVVEIAGDDLTISPNHGAGIAIRFPRLVGIREDKSPHEATTVTELKRMYDGQGSVAT